MSVALRKSSGRGISPGDRQRADLQSGRTSSLRRWSLPISETVKYRVSVIAQTVLDSIFGNHHNVAISFVEINEGIESIYFLLRKKQIFKIFHHRGYTWKIDKKVLVRKEDSMGLSDHVGQKLV
jgi:hypothetical protein